MAADFEAACTDMAMVRERVELVVAPDLSNDAVVDLYSKWARHYDQVCEVLYDHYESIN